MASLINMSGWSLLGKGLPYDYEVEYLESTGTQYIDTGLVSSQNLFEYDFEVACSNPTKQLCVIIGAANGFNVGVVSNIYRATGYCVSSVNASIDTFNHILFTSDPKNYELSLIIDNNSYSGVYNGFIYDNKLGLFALGNSISEINAKLKYASIMINGILVRDFIPVRVGTTGYLYDKVSGTLFGNQGTGDFILGADKQ